MGTAPEYLYHYTNIETLALILKNRTIRFNSLDKMDDLQENMTADLENAGKFVFISCWTDDKEESIPMWNMYASLERGVRIRLKTAPFEVYSTTADDLRKVSKLLVADATEGEPLKSIVPVIKMFEEGFIVPQGIAPDSIRLLHKVNYTNEQDKLYPKLISENKDNFSVALDKMGKYKNTHWRFQNEWRYILHILPLNINQTIDKSEKESLEFANKIRTDRAVQPFRFYDMVISDEAFADMQITMSPRISQGSKAIVESLVKEFNPNAKLLESAIAGLI